MPALNCDRLAGVDFELDAPQAQQKVMPGLHCWEQFVQRSFGILGCSAEFADTCPVCVSPETGESIGPRTGKRRRGF